MAFLKKIIPLLLVSISAIIAFYLDCWWEDAYKAVDSNKKVAFHLFYALSIAIILYVIFKIFEVNKLWTYIKYNYNKRGLNLHYSKDYEIFSAKIERHLASNESNRYLISCFDSLYRMIVSGDGFQKKGLLLKCSLIDAIDRIHNGAKLGKELYLFFLEKTVELKPKHVIGIWDIETNPIPSLNEMLNEEIFYQYEKMYKSLKKDIQNPLIRIFIYDQQKNKFDEAYDGSFEIIQYMEERWGIEKFYFIPKVRANINRIFDGLIIDDKFCLEFDGNDEVSFRKWNSNNSDCKNLTSLLDQCVKIEGLHVNAKEVIYSYPTIS